MQLNKKDQTEREKQKKLTALNNEYLLRYGALTSKCFPLLQKNVQGGQVANHQMASCLERDNVQHTT
jgi:hypothetical protein